MLLKLLTLLLPVRVPEPETAFHYDFVLHAYRDYHRRLQATGYRDRGLLRKLEKRTAYSMGILRLREPSFWRHITRYRNRVWALRSVTPVNDLPAISPEP